MITDRIQLAGLDAYFQDPNNPGIVNLTPAAPVTVRTLPLAKGKQVEISGLQLLIEGDDLNLLFQYQDEPLLRISVMKEMFAGLFADPFRHRVHNIAGYLDFNDGTLENGRIMEVDGIPTLCSTGKETCTWESKIYILPDEITINALAWELAASKNAPSNSFNYRLNVICFDDTEGTSIISTLGTDGNFFQADELRAVQLNDLSIVVGVKSFQIIFEANVNIDSYMTERSLPLFQENLGRPLLRAINILEPVQSVFEINSLLELQNLCSDFHLFETPGPEIKRLTATLDLSAVLVHSENEDLANGKYEKVELEVLQNVFSRFEAKKNGIEWIKSTQ